jgi:hypothetical protein
MVPLMDLLFFLTPAVVDILYIEIEIHCTAQRAPQKGPEVKKTNYLYKLRTK